MSHYHAVVWIDHQKASVQHFTRDAQEGTLIHAHGKHRHLHHHKGVIGSGNAPLDNEFFERVAQSLSGAHEILLVGPAQGKHEFMKFLEKNHPQLARQITGIKTADHPSDGELLDTARRYFTAADRMLDHSGTSTT